MSCDTLRLLNLNCPFQLYLLRYMYFRHSKLFFLPQCANADNHVEPAPSLYLARTALHYTERMLSAGKSVEKFTYHVTKIC